MLWKQHIFQGRDAISRMVEALSFQGMESPIQSNGDLLFQARGVAYQFQWRPGMPQGQRRLSAIMATLTFHGMDSLYSKTGRRLSHSMATSKALGKTSPIDFYGNILGLPGGMALGQSCHGRVIYPMAIWTNKKTEISSFVMGSGYHPGSVSKVNGITSLDRELPIISMATSQACKEACIYPNGTLSGSSPWH